jgi:hypothetical protein
MDDTMVAAGSARVVGAAARDKQLFFNAQHGASRIPDPGAVKRNSPGVLPRLSAGVYDCRRKRTSGCPCLHPSIRLMISSPNWLHFTSRAPSIRRAKS